MNRFGRWRSRPRSGWRRTARTEPWHGPGTGGSSAALLPDGSNHLSDGVVVETRLIARLLGVRLLRVEGTILMSPARLVAAAGARPAAMPRATYGAAARTSVRSPGGGTERPGDDLAEAARLLALNRRALGRADVR